MSTQLFLRDVIVANAPSALASLGTVLGVDTVRGNGVNSITTVTTASGNHIALGSTSTLTVFAYQVQAVTISGSISVNLWGNESANAVNSQFAVVISRYDNQGALVSDCVAQANANHARGTELTTSSLVQTWTVTTPTSTAFAGGDWLIIKPHTDAIGTMGAGSTAFAYDAASGGVSGDAFITFAETVVAFVPPVPYVSLMPPLLAQ